MAERLSIYAKLLVPVLAPLNPLQDSIESKIRESRQFAQGKLEVVTSGIQAGVDYVISLESKVKNMFK